MRQNTRHQTRNRIIRTTARTRVKETNKLIAASNLVEAEKSIREAIRSLDKAAEKGIIKKNNAARRKSRLMAKLNQLRTANK